MNFQTILSVSKEEMEADSLERPALVVTPDGTWRLLKLCQL